MSTPQAIERLRKLIHRLLQRLDELIRTIQGNIRFSFGTAAAIFIAGCAATLFFYFSNDPKFKDLPDLMKLGPGLISMAVSSFPIKLFMESRERVIYYKHLKDRCADCDNFEESELTELTREISNALKDVSKRG